MAEATPPSELDVVRLEIRAGFAETRTAIAEVRAAVAEQSSRITALFDAIADLRRDFNEHSHGDAA